MVAKKDNPIPGFEKATKDFCSGRIDRMIRQMADAEGINEEMKARNQLAWGRRIPDKPNSSKQRYIRA